MNDEPSEARNKAPRVAIIGGGISGLAAAHRVLELLPTAQLSLFEAAGRLGGVLETVERDGFLIERSADNFLATPTSAVDLCRQPGIDGDLVATDETRRRAFVVRNGQIIGIPAGFYLMSPRKLWPVLRSPLLSIGGKLRLLAEPFMARGPERDESVASFARRRLGREVFERLVQPLVAGIYTADPEKLSMAATMLKFREWERSGRSLLRATIEPAGGTQDERGESDASGARYGLFVAPRLGMQQLIVALTGAIPRDRIHLNKIVNSLHTENNAWHLAFNPQSEIRNPQLAFDALIVATPAHSAAKVLQPAIPELATELAAVEYAGCAVVSLGFHRRQIGHALDGFGFVVPQIERRRIIAASFASLKFPQRVPNGDVLIRVFIGGALQPELLDETDADLRRIAIEELASLLHTTGEPLLADIARWPRSMPQYHVGHLERVARIERLVDGQRGLALAGNAYRGVGIPQCIASGRAAAERIVSGLYSG